MGETGVENAVAVCPLCENWQTYLCESFGLLVREICPTTLWVEDDWRLRNHDASLGWGGCFCSSHMEIFSRQVGESVDREKLLKAILAPGVPHPWRREWFSLSCETLRAPLARLSQAIRSASPSTRVALMSSSPDAHSSEGRKWVRFQEAVGNTPTFISRPNMAPYTQVPALTAPPSLTRMTMANLTGAIEVYPELENSPRCGPYSKSRKYTGWQMKNCAMIGTDGVTINHYDMMGNGISLDPDFGKELSRAKEGLNRFRAEKVDDRASDGVEVLFSPVVSEYFHTEESGSLANLTQESYLWGDTCGILGIAHRYVSTISKNPTPVFVSGQTLRAFSREELEVLFSRPVILDAESVLVAIDLGLGSLIGVEAAHWELLADTGYSYEEIVEEDASIYGIRHPRMSAQRCSGKLLSMVPVKEARTLSTIRRYDHVSLWPGSVQYRNILGGTVMSLTYPVVRKSQYFMGFFNIFRRIFLQSQLFAMAPQAPLAMASTHPLHLYRSSTAETLRLAVTNPTDDAVDEVIIDLPSGSSEGGKWWRLDDRGSRLSISPAVEKAHLFDRFRFPIGLDYLEGSLLLWVRNSRGKLTPE